MPGPIFSSLTFLVAKNSLAPSFIASAFLDSVCEKTTTSQPILDANWIARCPRPPMPMTPARSVGLVPNCARVLKTVAPPHIKGAESRRSIEEGIRKRKASGQIACEPNEPWSRSWEPYMRRWGQSVSWPVRQCLHSMQQECW
jgi:hypothetical protein